MRISTSRRSPRRRCHSLPELLSACGSATAQHSETNQGVTAASFYVRSSPDRRSNETGPRPGIWNEDTSPPSPAHSRRPIAPAVAAWAAEHAQPPSSAHRDAAAAFRCLVSGRELVVGRPETTDPVRQTFVLAVH